MPHVLGGLRDMGAGAPVMETMSASVAETLVVAAPIVMDDRLKAKMQGFEGDPCGECGNLTLVRNGTCLKCNTCGGTSGCS
mgnify:CR=1 FL=1